MNVQCSIEEPRLVSNLPRPLEPAIGQTTFGPVYSWRGSRKRKRSEIVAAADGESINVYSINQTRLLTNHALSPRTYLTAPPCCIHKPSTRTKSGSRLTYAAIRNELGLRRYEVVGYGEELPKSIPGRSPAIGDTSKTERSLGSDDNPVVHLAPVSNGEDSFEVFTLRKQGQVSLWSQDLQEEKTSATVQQGHHNGDAQQMSTKVVVVHAQLEDARTLVEGALKNQPQLISRLLPMSQNDVDSLAGTGMLCVVTRTPDRRLSFDMWTVRAQSTVATASSRIQHLTSWDLNISGDLLDSGASFVFSPKTGILQCSTVKAVSSYSLTSSVPRRLSALQQHGRSICSALRMNGAWCLSTTDGEVGIYDQHYQTLQAVWSSRRPNSDSQSRKRRYADIESFSGPIRLLDYSPRLGVVLAVSENRLITFDIRLGRKDSRLGSSYQARLVSSMGRNGTNGTVSMHNDVEQNHWYPAQKTLDKLADECAETAYEDTWSTIMQDDTVPLDDLISQTLAHIFTLPNHSSASTRGSPLQVRFMPYKVFHTLLVTGRVTPQAIQRAIQTSADNASLLPPGFLDWPKLVRALETYDPTLYTLSEVVETSQYIPLEGLLNALSSLLRSFDDEPSSTQRYYDRSILPTPSTPGTPRTPNGAYTNGFSHSKSNSIASEQQIEEADNNALILAESDLEHASALLESGLEHRSIALRLVLNKIALSCPQSTILAPALRQHLPRRELSLLVELLRSELSAGGWSDHILAYTPMSGEDQASQAEPLTPICTLLTAAIDALGISGSLSSSSIDNDDLIPLLRRDTSSVLESIQESTFLSGFLQDFLRYHHTLQINARGSRRNKANQAVSEMARLGESEMEGILPIGMAKARGEQKMKTGIAGEVKERTKRELAYRRNREVGRYAFERLEV